MKHMLDDVAMEQLKEAARAAQGCAHAVHSGFTVGAALMTAAGDVFSGCNVESASYGLTLCAERSALAAWQLGAGGGGGRPQEVVDRSGGAGAPAAPSNAEIIAVVIATDAPTPTPPCGACRQWLAEFAPGALVTAVTYGVNPAEARWTVGELLPEPFTTGSMGPSSSST